MTREHKRMVKLDLFFQNYSFWAYIKKISTFIFWCMFVMKCGLYNYLYRERIDNFVMYLDKLHSLNCSGVPCPM